MSGVPDWLPIVLSVVAIVVSGFSAYGTLKANKITADKISRKQAEGVQIWIQPRKGSHPDIIFHNSAKQAVQDVNVVVSVNGDRIPRQFAIRTPTRESVLLSKPLNEEFHGLLDKHEISPAARWVTAMTGNDISLRMSFRDSLNQWWVRKDGQLISGGKQDRAEAHLTE